CRCRAARRRCSPCRGAHLWTLPAPPGSPGGWRSMWPLPRPPWLPGIAGPRLGGSCWAASARISRHLLLCVISSTPPNVNGDPGGRNQQSSPDVTAGCCDDEPGANGCRILRASSTGHAHDWLAEAERSGRAEEGRVAEGEDAAVGGHEPVAFPIWRGNHAHDWLAERQRSGGPEEAGVAQAEHAAVGGHEPVAAQRRI